MATESWCECTKCIYPAGMNIASPSSSSSFMLPPISGKSAKKVRLKLKSHPIHHFEKKFNNKTYVM